ncbi:hypothetical protein ASG31_06005 [Chryseobacterium sp. Leaf404]|nr:hypothetical protein ASG31_06005 [Chryseobacterium sp. Leaf404]
MQLSVLATGSVSAIRGNNFKLIYKFVQNKKNNSTLFKKNRTVILNNETNFYFTESFFIPEVAAESDDIMFVSCGIVLAAGVIVSAVTVSDMSVVLFSTSFFWLQLIVNTAIAAAKRYFFIKFDLSVSIVQRKYQYNLTLIMIVITNDSFFYNLFNNWMNGDENKYFFCTFQ